MLRNTGLRKIKAKGMAILSRKHEPPPAPHSVQTRTHRIFLNVDVLIEIISYLDKTSDHIAFATTSQWSYFVLKKSIYSHTVLRPDGPASTIIPKLLDDPTLCTHIVQLDIVLSARSKYNNYVPGRDDIQQMWQQKDNFVRDIQVILKRTTQLKGLSIDEEKEGESLRAQFSLELELRNFPFNLTSFKLGRSAPGALEFIGAHPELNHLTLTQRTNHPYDPECWHLGFSSLGHTLLKLRTLWATPWWMRALLMRSPVRTFGLLHKFDPIDYLILPNHATELSMTIGLLSALGNIGGHPTVRCLALPWNDFIMPSTPLNLRILSKAFPRTQTLAITLEPGQVVSCLANIPTDLPRLLKGCGTNFVFQSAREFCFLLPGEWPHEKDFNTPDIIKHGKDCDYAIPHALVKFMPGLVHIDTPDRCYSRVGAGVKHPGYGYRLGPLGGHDPVSVFGPEIRRGEWYGEYFFNSHVPPKDMVWFGRPRSECRLSRDWA